MLPRTITTNAPRAEEGSRAADRFRVSAIDSTVEADGRFSRGVTFEDGFSRRRLLCGEPMDVLGPAPAIMFRSPE
jgi:hypothetical protein